jgi:hypothetical protein
VYEREEKNSGMMSARQQSPKGSATPSQSSCGLAHDALVPAWLPRAPRATRKTNEPYQAEDETDRSKICGERRPFGSGRRSMTFGSGLGHDKKALVNNVVLFAVFLILIEPSEAQIILSASNITSCQGIVCTASVDTVLILDTGPMELNISFPGQQESSIPINVYDLFQTYVPVPKTSYAAYNPAVGVNMECQCDETTFDYCQGMSISLKTTIPYFTAQIANANTDCDCWDCNTMAVNFCANMEVGTSSWYMAYPSVTKSATNMEISFNYTNYTLSTAVPTVNIPGFGILTLVQVLNIEQDAQGFVQAEDGLVYRTGNSVLNSIGFPVDLLKLGSFQAGMPVQNIYPPSSWINDVDISSAMNCHAPTGGLAFVQSTNTIVNNVGTLSQWNLTQEYGSSATQMLTKVSCMGSSPSIGTTPTCGASTYTDTVLTFVVSLATSGPYWVDSNGNQYTQLTYQGSTYLPNFEWTAGAITGFFYKLGTISPTIKSRNQEFQLQVRLIGEMSFIQMLSNVSPNISFAYWNQETKTMTATVSVSQPGSCLLETSGNLENSETLQFGQAGKNYTQTAPNPPIQVTVKCLTYSSTKSINSTYIQGGYNNTGNNTEGTPNVTANSTACYIFCDFTGFSFLSSFWNDLFSLNISWTFIIATIVILIACCLCCSPLLPHIMPNCWHLELNLGNFIFLITPIWLWGPRIEGYMQYGALITLGLGVFITPVLWIFVIPLLATVYAAFRAYYMRIKIHKEESAMQGLDRGSVPSQPLLQKTRELPKKIEMKKEETQEEDEEKPVVFKHPIQLNRSK